MAQLHDELAPLDTGMLGRRAAKARDPLTGWAAQTLLAEPRLDLEAFLSESLERRYSASPDEEFLTGAGIHHFGNFESEDNDRILSIREALIHSTNLVFIRLMRELVRFRAAPLPYDADAVLEDVDFPARKRLLAEIAAEEERKQPNTSFAWLLNNRNREAQDLRLRIGIERDAFQRMTPYWHRLGFPFETLVPSYATAIGSSAGGARGAHGNHRQRRPTAAFGGHSRSQLRARRAAKRAPATIGSKPSTARDASSHHAR